MSPTTAATPSDGTFVRVAPDVWLLSQSVEAGRIERLRNSPPYKGIVAQLGRTATVNFHKRERASKKPAYFRVVVGLSADSISVDLFHNSASGYRAQYYHGCENGIQANRYALSELTPVVINLVAERFKRTCPAQWIKRSLLDTDAKIWIRQGLWIRHAMVEDRQLLVSRWLKEQMCQDQKRRKKAVWASLIPHAETQLELKGGFLTLDGEPLGGLKPARAKNIHELGFT